MMISWKNSVYLCLSVLTLLGGLHVEGLLPCGCKNNRPLVDFCGVVGGGAGFPTENISFDESVSCSDCKKDVDHCGVCGGCQLPFVTSNVTTMLGLGLVGTGNKLGSLAGMSNGSMVCGQYHSADLPPSLPTDPYGFSQELPPSVPFTWGEQYLSQIPGASLGHSSDTSDDFLIVGNPLPDTKTAHFYVSTPPPSPPYSWFFDLEDPCGGNLYGWDVAVGEDSGFIGVCDPKAYLAGVLWMYEITGPDLVQRINPPGTGLVGDRFCSALDMDNDTMAVGAVGCDSGSVSDVGCVTFYVLNATRVWITDGPAVVGSPSSVPVSKDGFGASITMTSEWAFVGYNKGYTVEVFHRNGSPGAYTGGWTWTQTLTAPGLKTKNRYGRAMQARDHVVVIGDENYVVSARARGKVWLYRLQAGVWNIWSSYTDDTSSVNTRFGAALDLTDEYIVVGIPNKPPYGFCMVASRNISACYGCDSIINSCKQVDSCGVCGGNNTACAGCDGIPNSGKTYDGCGVCGGDETSCLYVTPTLIEADCSDNQNIADLSTTTVLLRWLPHTNKSLPVNFTIADGSQIPSGVKVVLKSNTGNISITPPLLYEGSFTITIKACYVVPKGKNGFCNNTDVTITVLPCKDCFDNISGGLRFDVCGVCGGDGTSCAGCDGVANSGLLYDSCGVCGGNDCACISAIVPPLIPQPCNPGYPILMAFQPPSARPGWSIVQKPIEGSAYINPRSGYLVYAPPKAITQPYVEITLQIVSLDCPYPKVTNTTVVHIPSSLFIIDSCGICGGDGLTCLGCDGLPNSGLVYDYCGVCGGDSSTCLSHIERECDSVCVLFIIFVPISIVFLLCMVWNRIMLSRPADRLRRKLHR